MDESLTGSVEIRIAPIASLRIWPALMAAISILSLGCGPQDVATGRVANLRQSDVAYKNALPALTDIRGVEQHPFRGGDAVANVVVFTMQDCPIANSYIPTLNKLAEVYGPRGIRLLLVHVDPQFTTDDARKHADEYHIIAPVVIDRQHAWVDRAGATRSPEVAIFSPAGEILYSGRIDDRYAALGKRRTHVSTHDLRDAIEAILAGSSVARSKTEAIGCHIPPLPPGD